MKNNKLAVLIFSAAIILGGLFGEISKVDALESATNISTYNDDTSCRKYPCSRGGFFLKESINKLEESGTLTKEDVKKIDSYMIKDRQAKDDKIKEEIYNSECEKIDKMVSEKVITKEKGEKIKATVKENIQNMHMRGNMK